MSVHPSLLLSFSLIYDAGNAYSEPQANTRFDGKSAFQTLGCNEYANQQQINDGKS